MDSYIAKKIEKKISLARSFLDDLDNHVGKMSEDDIAVCQALLESDDAKEFLNPQFLEHIEAVINITKNKLIKIAEQNLQSLTKR